MSHTDQMQKGEWSLSGLQASSLTTPTCNCQSWRQAVTVATDRENKACYKKQKNSKKERGLKNLGNTSAAGGLQKHPKGTEADH